MALVAWRAAQHFGYVSITDTGQQMYTKIVCRKVWLCKPRSKEEVAMSAGGRRRYHSRWIYVSAVMAVALVGNRGGSLSGSSTDVARGRTAGVESGQGQQSQPPAWVRHFPLWMDVPTKSFAVLGEGTVRQQRWGVYTFRGKGKAAGKRPCIELATLFYGLGHRGASFTSNSACGPLAPPAEQPVIEESGITVQKKVNGPTVSDTVIAMTVARSVIDVRLHLEPGPSQTKRTRLLSTRQAAKAHVQQFRYVAFGLARKECISAVTAFDETGTQLFETATRDCR